MASKPREYIIGVNIAGGEFGSKNPDYGWPSAETLDYFKNKGFKLIRLPFSWERLQPELGKELDPGYAKALLRTVDMIGDRGMLVLLDLHNYAKYRGKKISQGGFTIEQFRRRVEPHREARKAEPEVHLGLRSDERAVRGRPGSARISGRAGSTRSARSTRRRASRSAARRWRGGQENPVQFHLKDPARAIVFEKHFYFDHDSSGRYANTYEEEINRRDVRVGPMIGVERLKRFVTTCQKYNVQYIIGEFGVPAGDGVDTRWLDAMDNAMAYMHKHRVSSTYWAAGDYWTRRGTTYVIGRNGWKPGTHEGEDRPQVKVLTKYIQKAEVGK